MRRSRKGRPSWSERSPLDAMARSGTAAARAAARWSTRGITRSAMRLLSRSDAARAIHLDANPRNEGGFVAGEVQRRVGHVERGGKPPKGDGREEFRTPCIVDGPPRELSREARIGVEDGV